MASWKDPQGKSLTDYPRPSLAVDTAVLTVKGGRLCVALVPRYGSLRLPGTFLFEGELLAGAVARSLERNAGLKGVQPRQLHTFDALDRDDRGRVLSVAHMIALPEARLSDVELVPVERARGLDFDHDDIVRVAVASLRESYRERPDPERLLGEEFTLRDLHQLHCAVDASTAQKDTFRRAMLPLLEETGRQESGAVGKPAQLFTRGLDG